jgi:ATP-binding cassette subfamily B protein
MAGKMIGRLDGSARWQLIRQLPAVAPRLTAVVAALTLIDGFIPSARALAGGALVAAVAAAAVEGPDAPAARGFGLAVGALTAAVVAQMGLGPWRATAVDALARRFARTTLERQMGAMLRPATIAHLEEPALLDLMERARNTGGVGPRPAVTALLSQVNSRLRGSVALVVVAGFDWRLSLVLLGALLWRNRRVGAVYRQVLPALWGQTEALRRSDYFRTLAMGAAGAKELRVFGLADWAVARLRETWLAGMTPVWQERRGAGLAIWLANLPAIAAVLLAFGLLARAALVQEIGIGPLAAYVQALFVVFSNFGGNGGDPYLDPQVEYGAAGLRPLVELEAATAHPRLRLPGTRPAEGLPAREIRFEGVRFRYPDQVDDTLRGVDLAIPAGRSLAIVGENGSGKTTLIKLLARLYDPTEGRVLVDGVDMRELDARAWQRRVAAVFQDFVMHALPAAENVGFGAVERLGDRAALVEAARRAGALEIVERLPKGWETVLSRRYTGGVELSGGEWQRIALARALFAAAAGAGVLVLDEPTAHLDARAEAAFYESFLELTRGCTAIVISHRFSTVRRADSIVVLERGLVVEQGSHEALVAMGGRYAGMFRLQAARFAEAATGG